MIFNEKSKLISIGNRYFEIYYYKEILFWVNIRDKDLLTNIASFFAKR